MADKDGNKTGGREKGTGNKNLEPIRLAFREFVENNLGKVQENFDELSDKDKLYFILNFAEYCIPKLQRTELTGENGNPIKVQTYSLPDGTKIEFS